MVKDNIVLGTFTDSLNPEPPVNRSTTLPSIAEQIFDLYAKASEEKKTDTQIIDGRVFLLTIKNEAKLNPHYTKEGLLESLEKAKTAFSGKYQELSDQAESIIAHITECDEALFDSKEVGEQLGALIEESPKPRI